MPQPAADAPIRVLVVDDQPLVRTGFKMVISSQSDLDVVGEASDGVEALEFTRAHRIDVVLMDVRMPRMDGIEATRRIVENGAGGQPVKVIVLTTFDLDEYVMAAIKAGASGFLLKDAEPEEMLTAIRTVHAGDAVIAPSTTRRLLEHLVELTPRTAAQPAPELADLTAREREVLVQMAHGYSNTEIAAALYVAEATVKTHVGRVLAKLGARDRVQAVVIAYETGLVKAGER